MKVSETEEDLLKRLSEAVKWAGRYPIDSQASDSRESRGIFLSTGGDLQLVESLAERILELHKSTRQR